MPAKSLKLPQSVMLGLTSLVEGNESTIASMLSQDGESGAEALVAALTECMSVNNLSAEALLARFFDASLLGDYCAAQLGKSAKGNASTLAARIAREWAKPSFAPRAASKAEAAEAEDDGAEQAAAKRRKTGECDWVRRGRWWIAHDPNAQTRAEVARLVEAGDSVALRALLADEHKMVFGTSGLRAAMGPGVGRMNDLTVIQASQALCCHVLAHFGDAAAKQRGVVVGYDHRSHAQYGLSSERFAHLCAAAFAHRGVRVILLDGAVPTPLVPFAIIQRGCAAGVMVTASHNPPIDNGYKVYWENGSQIVPPHDARIAAELQRDANQEPWTAYDPTPAAVRALAAVAGGGGLGAAPTAQLREQYLRRGAAALCRFRGAEGNGAASAPRVCYTALHGVGASWVRSAFEAFGHAPFVGVEAQLDPDPAFPTLPFPNPEEPGALDCAMRVGDERGCKLIIANDPDADRLGVAERLPGGGWRLFKGDEIGVLLATWEWQQLQRRRRESGIAAADAPPAAVVASTVSSKMLRAIAVQEGFRFEECLTGFKWIGNTVDRLRQREGHDVFFSYEESIGFCVGDIINDKDGILAAACFVEMAAALRRASPPRTVSERMDELYAKYGHFCQNNSYYKIYEPGKMAQIFERLRNGGKYWERVGEYEIENIRDLTTGHDSSQPDGRAVLPCSSSSQMITYDFRNGCVATFRGSGTEPKLKYYIEMAGKPGVPRADAQAAVDRMASVLVQEMLQPDANGLEACPE